MTSIGRKLTIVTGSTMISTNKTVPDYARYILENAAITAIDVPPSDVS